MKRLTIGILAHVDSGKTTLSEALLYTTGVIRKLGRVDKKDAFLDSYSLERERGITIFSKQAEIQTQNSAFTLIDTPGHVDFSPETERTLDILDAAILVISATAGIQSHTKTLWKLLSKKRIPTFIFVNKTDLPNADKDAVLSGLKSNLSQNCIHRELIGSTEECAVCSESLMESFLGNGISAEEISSGIMHRNIFPVYFGSALKLDGIDALVSGLDEYLPDRQYPETFSAKIYKVTHDSSGSRLVHLKITGGELCVKDELSGTDRNGKEWHEKINQIRVYNGEKYTVCDKAFAGGIYAVTGLSKAGVGETIGNGSGTASYSLEPVLNYRLIPPAGISPQTCFSVLKSIEDEEPTLHCSFNTQNNEINVMLMGEIQLDVLKKRLCDGFGIDASFGDGTIVYRETITETAEGIGHFEPLRHYAEVHLILEPAERGSGLMFCTDCDENQLSRNWQRLILTHLEEKIHKGVLTGSPITDMKITLVAGKAHKKHTEGGDFREATYRAVRQGLMKAGSILLEPWYNFELHVQTSLVGKAMSDLQNMSAVFSAPDSDGEFSVIKGRAPVYEMRSYSKEVAGFTHGKGTLICELKGYEKCHNSEEVIVSFGYDPGCDIYNPCSSVFCANGSGFIVDWQDVEKYMHIESVFEQSSEQAEEKRLLRIRAENYCRAAATDKELMEIFERTYGKIKPRENSKPKLNPSARQNPQKNKPQSVKNNYDGEEFLLIDGYNIIFAWDELRRKADESLENARNELISRMSNYQGFCGYNIVIVFDAYKVKKNPGSVEKHRNISVVYTKEAETADTYIERVSKKLSKHHRVRVATSDGPEQMIILGNGALRVPAAALKKELTDAEKAIREIMENFS